MLAIRLARTGRTKYPTYRIVAADSKRPATGKFVSILGNYNPHTKEISLKKDEIEQLLKNGAQPSNTVVRLLKREKVALPKWVVLTQKTDKKAAAAEEAAKAPKEEAAEESAPTAEAAVVTQAEANAEAHGDREDADPTAEEAVTVEDAPIEAPADEK